MGKPTQSTHRPHQFCQVHVPTIPSPRPSFCLVQYWFFFFLINPSPSASLFCAVCMLEVLSWVTNVVWEINTKKHLCSNWRTSVTKVKQSSTWVKELPSFTKPRRKRDPKKLNFVASGARSHVPMVHAALSVPNSVPTFLPLLPLPVSVSCFTQAEYK